MDEWRAGPHRRFNPLAGEWVLVSPHRLQRPWQGAVATSSAASRPAYDPACYLCPGNERAGGVRNPQYEKTFVFDNDYPALLADTPAYDFQHGILSAEAESGLCRVVCFSPRHDLDIAQMPVREIAAIVDTWAEQFAALAALPSINAVTIFENRGAMMGASNPHPHGQIWAQTALPKGTVTELRTQREFLSASGTCLLCSYAEQERSNEERLVYQNEHIAVIAPFWAIWPFEVLVIPHRHVAALDALTSEERTGLADAMHALTSRYDRLFETTFPYTMGFHQAPADGNPHDEWHLHAHYYPPLLRSASVRKFMVGYEMLAEPQRDITPEQAAAQLRALAPP